MWCDEHNDAISECVDQKTRGILKEDADAYSPLITRLLVYAEIDNDSEHGYH